MIVFKNPMRQPEIHSDGRRRRLARAALRAALGLCVLVLPGGGAESAASVGAQAGNAADSAKVKDGAGLAAQLFGEARTLFENENWAAAAAKFEEFLTAHPRDLQADAALYWLATALKKQERFQAAGQALARLSKEFPRSSWASDARVMRVELASLTGDRPAIEKALADEDEDVRLVALQSLVRLEPERAAEVAAEVLKPGSAASPRMKLAVVALLENAGRGAATSLLVEVVRRETDQKLRKAAIYALGRGGHQGALEFLKGLVVSGGDDEIAKSAAFAIAQLPGTPAGEFLGELARTAPSREMRRSVVNWLAHQNTETAVGELVKTFDAAGDAETKALCLLALGQSNLPRAQDKLAEVARQHAEPEVRMHAILGMGLRGEERGVNSLLALYDAEADETVKEWVLAALGMAGQKRGLRKLMDVAAGDASARLRRAALKALTRVGGDPAVEKFLRERRM